MFDKYRARWAKLEEDHEAVRKVRLHVEKHQVVYASGVTGLVCIFGTRAFARPTQIINIVEQAAPVVAPVFNNHNIGNVVNNTVNNGGHMRKIIRCIETGQMWTSMTDAALAQGKSLAMMSNHIHDRGVDSLNGLHFVIEGLAA